MAQKNPTFIRFVVGADDQHHRELTGIVTEVRFLRDDGRSLVVDNGLTLQGSVRLIGNNTSLVFAGTQTMRGGTISFENPAGASVLVGATPFWALTSIPLNTPVRPSRSSWAAGSVNATAVSPPMESRPPG